MLFLGLAVNGVEGSASQLQWEKSVQKGMHSTWSLNSIQKDMLLMEKECKKKG